MAEKKFKGAPFGTQAARFDVSAVHPANKRAGTYTEIPYCKRWISDPERNRGPGSYNVDSGDFSLRAVTEKAKGPGWHRAQETARLAQTPQLLYREAWENKRFLKTKVGPGTYRTIDFIEELEKKPTSVRGVCEGREERFRETKSQTPGPGSYGKGGVPWAALEEKRAQTAGCVNMDLWSGLKRFPKGTTDCGLSPCTYTLKSSTDVILNSSSSKRGPYDLFTGRRDRAITAGYFAAPKHTHLTPGEYDVQGRGFGDELRGGKKHGAFSTLEQYPTVHTERIYHSTLSQCPRRATSPGPGWYETTSPSCPESRSPPPFLSSAPRLSKRLERLRIGNHSSVGPGRYDIAGKGQRKAGNGPSSSFSSRTERYLTHLHRDKHAQERLRAVNVPVERQRFLVPFGPSGENAVMTSA